MGKLLIHASHGKEDPERATLPFILGNNAVLAGEEAIVLLTTDAVWLATEGGAEGVAKDGMPPLQQAMTEFIEGGGEVWACQACTKPRQISEDHLVKGAKIGAAMQIVEYLSQGASSITF